MVRGSRYKKRLALFAKRQLVRFSQLTAWCQHRVGECKVGGRLEAKLRGILNRGVNHLVGQLRRTGQPIDFGEQGVTDFVLVTRPGNTARGKRFFEPETERIEQVDPKTEMVIRLLPSQKELDQSHLMLLPVGADPTFDKWEGARTAGQRRTRDQAALTANAAACR